MKKIFLLFSVIVIFTSCQDVVDINTPNTAPKLVVDASLQWEKGTAGNEQKIKLSMTTNYFSEIIPAASGATVLVSNSVGTNFNFIENASSGEYVCSTFIPQIGEVYTLRIDYLGQTYFATETMKSVPEITRIEQETRPGFDPDKDLIQVRAYFLDPGNSTDYYLFRYQTNFTAIPEFLAIDDEFFQGNEIFGLYQNEDLKPGNLLEIKAYGISERYFNYMAILTSIAGSAGGAPFQTPSSTLRGNVVNSTNPDNFPLGFFSIGETSTKLYTVY